MQRTRPILSLLFGASLFVSMSAGRAASAQDPAALAPETVRALFEKNCATCHGSNGDGKGTQVLEKPARSFKDGGFSYGNTKETITRTLSNGIPGTPMPSFGSALKPAELAALADYVIALGPPQAEVKRSDTLLVVRDQPLFVRGKLPPIVDGAPETVRGLLVGTTDGLTFEYAVDDVRLLGVRQGEFVERKDWGGRGGDAVQPLGKLIYDCGVRANAASTFALSGTQRGVERALRASLRGTQVRGSQARVVYGLRANDAPDALEVVVTESMAARSLGAGSGFVRSLDFDERAHHVGSPLIWRIAQNAAPTLVASERKWCVRARLDGVHEAQLLTEAAAGDVLRCDGERVTVSVDLATTNRRRVEVVTLLLPEWNNDVRRQLEQELAR